MRTTFRGLGCVLLIATFATLPTFAQQDDDTISGLIIGFFTEDLFLNPGAGHQGHFLASERAVASLASLNTALASQLSTVPPPPSAGGFTYRFDPTVGVPTRTSDSFGPVFSERALLIGKKKWNVGVVFLHARYDSFDGFDLRGGDLKFTLQHVDNENDGRFSPWFQGDLVDTQLALDLTVDTSIFFADFGLTDRIDLAVIVPVVRIDVEADLLATIAPLATGSATVLNPNTGTQQRIHQFPDGSLTNTYSRSASASGVGDLGLRIKWRAIEKGNYGMALQGELRLPTGDEEDLLGTGTTRAKAELIVSTKYGNFWPHLNLSYTSSFGDSSVIEDALASLPDDVASDLPSDLPDELRYVLGFDLALTSRSSFSFDVIGRTLLDAARLGERTVQYQFNQTADPTDPPSIGTVSRPELFAYEGDLTSIQGAVGVKINLADTWLLSTGVLFPLGDADGLVDDATVVLGVDYTF